MHSSVIAGKSYPVNSVCSIGLFHAHKHFRALARKLTYALAASFQEYSRRVKESEQQQDDNSHGGAKKKFAIDLRTPEEMKQAPEDQETEA